MDAFVTSSRRACSIKHRVSSIQVIKSSTPQACLANRWAGLLPYLLTYENIIAQNSLHISCMPCTAVATEEGGVDNLHIAWWMISESPSMIKSLLEILKDLYCIS